MLNSYLIYIFAENHKSTLMKPTTYIDWDGLKDIPFFYCDTKEDEENKDFDIYYQGKLVLHDYNHCGHYLYTAAVLFSRIKNKTADWVNLRNLWILSRSGVCPTNSAILLCILLMICPPFSFQYIICFIFVSGIFTLL